MEREPAKSFEDLIVWQKSHKLTLRVYKLTSTFPKHEVYGLSSQMRRAAVSIAGNIAEGFKKRGRPDKARVMNIAQASVEELRYYFVLAKDLEYLATDAEWMDVDEVSRLLGAYTRTLLTPTS
ncbi:MAG: four helix bundle protein [Acidobacteria bacterium]|nr:four helix bundle protein [Acidobacteriota bacterium]MCA1650522.1 four helix bundle protein [Acidobacteriota bacterium]